MASEVVNLDVLNSTSITSRLFSSIFPPLRHSLVIFLWNIVTLKENTWFHTSEDSSLHIHRCYDLQSHRVGKVYIAPRCLELFLTQWGTQDRIPYGVGSTTVPRWVSTMGGLCPAYIKLKVKLSISTPRRHVRGGDMTPLFLNFGPSWWVVKLRPGVLVCREWKPVLIE